MIYEAWLDYNVIVVRGQDLELDDFLRYSRRFGVLRKASVEKHAPSGVSRDHTPRRQQIPVPTAKLDMAIYRRGAEGWHTDGAYDEVPFKATQLYALAIPSRGGDTLFASMYAAYDALPAAAEAAPRRSHGAYVYGGRRKTTALSNPEDRDKQPALHPIIRTHPETGRKVALLRSRQDPAYRRARRGRERRADRGAERLHGPARRRSTTTSGARATSSSGTTAARTTRRRATTRPRKIASTGASRSRTRSGR